MLTRSNHSSSALSRSHSVPIPKSSSPHLARPKIPDNFNKKIKNSSVRSTILTRSKSNPVILNSNENTYSNPLINPSPNSQFSLPHI